MLTDGGDEGSQGAGRENRGGQSENWALQAPGSCPVLPERSTGCVSAYMPTYFQAGLGARALGSGPSSTSSTPKPLL